jgi:putative CocE/NonD family hydrolase
MSTSIAPPPHLRSLWFPTRSVAFLIAAGTSQSANAQTSFEMPVPKTEFTVEKNVMIPMRDGVRLAANLYFPKNPGPRWPVILLRTPYDKDNYRGSTLPAEFFAGQGYAVVSQDVRGKFSSEGDYQVQSHDQVDGFDTIDWIVAQPWSSGKVGTYGCSYLGENQILLSGARHPHHLAAVPQAAAGGLGSGGGYWSAFGMYVSGVPSISSGFGWFLGAGAKDKGAKRLENVDFPTALRSLPTADMVKNVGGPRSDWEDFMTHRPGDAYWSTQGYATDTTRYDVPAIHVNSWFDYGAEQTLYLFDLFRRNGMSPRSRENQFVIISPTPHCASERAGEHTKVGDFDVGDARLGYYRIYLDWFDHWLKDVPNRVLEMPKVRYYLIGKGEWRTARTWPLPEMRPVSYYLSSTAGANTGSGDGALVTTRPVKPGRDTVTYDPDNPFPSRGGTICCTGNPNDQPGIFDQADLAARPDVLVYSTPPLSQGLTITGPVRARLYVSSDQKDTDFTAKVLDVDESGKAWNVVDGIVRVRYRNGVTNPVLMEPGKVYPVEINLKSIAWYFKPGHRVRLYLANSDFPEYERNLNTGGNIFDESTWVVAHNTVHTGGATASALILPVVPR